MKLRIATFNLENLDNKPSDTYNASLESRIKILRPQLQRINADIICFQEINGQETAEQPRQLLALKELLNDTLYSDFHILSTLTSRDEVYDERNLVIVSRFPFLGTQQHKNEEVPPPFYQKVTASPKENEAKKVEWERPIFYAKVDVGNNFILHLFNVHLKSRLPSDIKGQKINSHTWRTNAAWAEGYFISSMKRVGQSLELRVLIDKIFENEPDAKIIVCGDFNAHPDEVPVEVIRGRVENTGNAALLQFEMIACANSIPETSRYTYIHQGEKRLLDHLLMSRAMLPYFRKTEIHNETLHDESLPFANDAKFPESDHAPFIAEFEI